MLHIGIDFDNTIVSYHESIPLLAEEFFVHLPDDLPLEKVPLRNYLRSVNRESEWTEFQGLLYGPGMLYAKPYTGCIETLHTLQTCGFLLTIISHRSRFPYAGPKYDLHQHANSWIERHLIPHDLFSSRTNISSLPYVHPFNFLGTLNEKLQAISRSGCDVFIDDLPEVLNHNLFPPSTTPFLFSPSPGHATIDIASPRNDAFVVSNWSDLPTLLNNISSLRT